MASIFLIVVAIGLFAVAGVVGIGIVVYVNSQKSSNVHSDPHQPPKPKKELTQADLKEIEKISPEIIKALEGRQKILAIKVYREENGVDLREAKEYIEDIQERLF
ncbi:MAG: hypothetical protein AB8G95_23120 [Anaerolineae bacterium]